MVTDPLPPGLPVSEELFRSFPAEAQAVILSLVGNRLMNRLLS